jgi:hypothetical protein
VASGALAKKATGALTGNLVKWAKSLVDVDTPSALPPLANVSGGFLLASPLKWHLANSNRCREQVTRTGVL